jgi:LAO/AO transport system kinase
VAPRLSIAQYRDGIRQGDRVILARAITLVESRLASDQKLAEELLNDILPFTGNSIRVGISGVPGVGKSTFIDAFGTFLTGTGKKVAVLAVDPSSSVSRGSILGDKTRMARLSVDPMAFIRPTATGGTLGGVASHTRESMLLCEAAGYEWILVETVGVGQSETLVHGMVDFFLLLMLAGAGDELQGIKRGIMELCDALLINKADGDNISAAKRAAADYKNALHLFTEKESGWIAEVMTVSAITDQGMEAVAACIERYALQTRLNGWFDKNRLQQERSWLMELIENELQRDFRHFREKSPVWSSEMARLEKGETAVRSTFKNLMDAYRTSR